MAEGSTEMMKKTNETRLTLSSLGGEDSRRLHRGDAPLGLRKVGQISQIIFKKETDDFFFRVEDESELKTFSPVINLKG